MSRSSLVRGKSIPHWGMVGAKAPRHKRTWHVWELVKTMGISDVWGAKHGRWKEKNLKRWVGR